MMSKKRSKMARGFLPLAIFIAALVLRKNLVKLASWLYKGLEHGNLVRCKIGKGDYHV